MLGVFSDRRAGNMYSPRDVISLLASLPWTMSVARDTSLVPIIYLLCLSKQRGIDPEIN